jgi:TPR repeat protein
MRRGDRARTPAGSFDLGLRYYRGEGMPQDHREAARLFRLAADQGHAQAHCCTALCYYRGEGVQQNLETAARWYRLAADQGQADAQANLALCYSRGDSLIQNLETAARWYRIAADQGHAQAQYSIALCHVKGEGVPQNLSECARTWASPPTRVTLVRSATMPSTAPTARACLKTTASARYHRLAADQGYAPSQLALGAMLIDDEPGDPCAGARLLARAAQSVGLTTSPIASRRSGSSAITPPNARWSQRAALAAGRSKG